MTDHTTAESQLLDRLDEYRKLLIEMRTMLATSYIYASMRRDMIRRINEALAQDAPKEKL